MIKASVVALFVILSRRRRISSEVLPECKKALIVQLQEAGHVVAMVGDGMNDSPALSWADVGISMKHGADLAQEAADAILLDGRLEGMIEGRQIAQATLRRIQQNFYTITIMNTLFILFGMTGFLPPVLSAISHNATTLLVSLNSLRPYPGSSS